uniref:Aminotransferase class I/classII large domain-containing protein n=2 Tax=Clytia hemisphaerica TaxID=252671 RepID=A0A7M5UZD8_9CNID
MAFWDLPEFHCEMIKPLCNEAQRLSLESRTLYDFKYGDVPFIAPGFTEELAKFLIKEYDDNDIKSSTLLPTFGATNALQFVMNRFFDNGDHIMMEEITYGRATQFAKMYKMKVHAVSSTGKDDCDVSLTHLEELLQKYGRDESELTEEKPFRGMMFLLPILNNPKGTSFSEECCRGVVKLARKYKYLVVTDDVYQWFQFNDEPKKKRLIYYDKLDRDESGYGNVISNATISKIAFPSIRIGWLEATTTLVKQLCLYPHYESSGGMNTFNQNLLMHILRLPSFPAYCEKLKATYKKVLAECCEYLRNNLPENVTFRYPDGSAFLWVQLPEKYDARDLRKLCNENDTDMLPGTQFTLCPEKYRHFFRISVTNGNPETRMESLKRICEAVKKLVN